MSGVRRRSGAFRGTVTRVDAVGWYVEVPRLGAGVEYGPCELADGFYATAGDPVHEHGVDPVPGDRVLVVTIAENLDDLVLVGKLRGPA